MKNLNEDKIEKEIITKIEKKKYKGNNTVQKVQKVYEKEIINEDETINIHFEVTSENIEKILKSKKIKKNLYNEAFGEYIHQGYSENQSIGLSKITSISKNLIDKEITKTLEPIDGELDKSDNFIFRFFKYLDSYSDICINSTDLMLRQKLMNTYMFHILNHVFKRKEEIEINDKIEKVNALKDENRLNITQKLEKEFFVDENEEILKKYSDEVLTDGDFFSQFHRKINMSNELKDQGFTTPKVLILLPYKKHAKLIMDEIVGIFGDWKGVSNKKKFQEEFSEEESNGDMFRIGIRYDYIENKLKLYQPFNESDIIIASPLGLKLADKVYDFLSSIEILLIDFAEIFLFQKTDHLEEILKFVNKTPKNNQNIVDINRIKDNIKDNALKSLRQNIIVSHYKSIEIECLVKEYCNNISGMYIFNEKYENIFESKEMADCGGTIKLEFKMLRTLDEDINTYRFEYFTKNVN